MKKQLFLFCLLAVLFACKREIQPIETELTPLPYNPPAVNITATIQGSVVDESGVGLVGVEVKLGTVTQTTGEAGTFRFKNVQANQQGALLEVNQAGYFKATKRVLLSPNSDNIVSIKLLTKTVAGQVQSSTGGTVTAPSGAKIKLPANGIVRSDGSVYIGEVAVATRWLDPTDPNTFATMPGSLAAIQDNANEVTLITYGMLGVELNGSNGEALNLAEGAEAELTFPLPANIVADAPAEIDLWHMDESTGLWRNEGKAQLVGNTYVGKVSHFSFWNCDVASNAITLSGNIVYDGDKPLQNVLVTVFTGSVGAGSATTNANGSFSGFVPGGVVLTLTVYDACGDAVYTQNIGPFTADTDLGNINITLPGINSVSGTVVDCDNVAIDNALVLLNAGNISASTYSDATGGFSMSYSDCDASTAQIKVYDFGGGTQSELLTFTPAIATNLGNVEVCGDSINNDLDFGTMQVLFGDTLLVNNLGDSLQFYATGYIDGNDTIYDIIYIAFGNGSTGFSLETYDSQNFEFQVGVQTLFGVYLETTYKNNLGEYISYYNSSADNCNLVISSLDFVNGMISGTFQFEVPLTFDVDNVSTGQYLGLETKTVSGSFNLPLIIEYN